MQVTGRLLAVVLAGILLAGVACSKDAPEEAAPSCAAPSAAAEASLPQAIPLDSWGTVVSATEAGGRIEAEAISETTIVELYPEIVRTLTESGYTLLGGDNEGTEAEIAFAGPDKERVAFTLRQTDCEDQVSIRLTIEQP